ncbi:MAG TPA: ethanolamine utilization protein [Clostridiaceae bacterium]|nr:ethanolamine utilization protein [Clostridiaceae bacterium]
MEALGMIETLGYIGAVEALDVSLKSANVEFAGCELIGGGLVTIKVTGDVGAVNASIEAAEAAVHKVGKLISSFVIPKPADEVFEIFCEHREKAASKNDLKQEAASENETVQAKEKIIVPTEDEVKKQDKSEALFKMRQELEKMKVVELRNLARQMDLNSLTRKDIKFAKKRQLIKAILDHYTRRSK